jgi:hypothetical protein
VRPARNDVIDIIAEYQFSLTASPMSNRKPLEVTAVPALI